MFEGDSADACGGKFPLMFMGGKGGPVKRAQTGSEDPHGRERKLNNKNKLKEQEQQLI